MAPGLSSIVYSAIRWRESWIVKKRERLMFQALRGLADGYVQIVGGGFSCVHRPNHSPVLLTCWPFYWPARFRFRMQLRNRTLACFTNQENGQPMPTTRSIRAFPRLRHKDSRRFTGKFLWTWRRQKEKFSFITARP